MGFDDTAGVNRIHMDSHRKYALSRINLTKFNALFDGRNFYDQPISDKIRKYDELRKVTTGEGEDYTTGCLLDYKYFKDHHLIITWHLSLQKELDPNTRSIQQIEANFMLTDNNNSQILTVLDKSKETVLEFYKGTAKVL